MGGTAGTFDKIRVQNALDKFKKQSENNRRHFNKDKYKVVSLGRNNQIPKCKMEMVGWVVGLLQEKSS